MCYNGNSGKECVLRHIFDSKEFCETLRSESHSLRHKVSFLTHRFTGKPFLLLFRKSDCKSFIFYSSERVRKFNLSCGYLN
jgi:hypothetical protein